MLHFFRGAIDSKCGFQYDDVFLSTWLQTHCKPVFRTNLTNIKSRHKLTCAAWSTEVGHDFRTHLKWRLSLKGRGGGVICHRWIPKAVTYFGGLCCTDRSVYCSRTDQLKHDRCFSFFMHTKLILLNTQLLVGAALTGLLLGCLMSQDVLCVSIQVGAKPR